MKNDVNNVMKGAMILSLASFIAKILSAMYRIPFENIVGNLGFYVYQQVYPIYAIGMTFALSGFPIFISKVIAEQDNMLEKRVVARKMFKILLIFSLVCFSTIQIFSDNIALAMGDVKLKIIIQSVAWMFLLIPFLSVGRGFYQGMFNMLPTAYSQIFEQLIRVGFIIAVAWYASKNNWSIYKMGAWAMFGSTLGGIVALLCFITIFTHRQVNLRNDKKEISYKKLTQRLMTEGMMLCLFTSLMILLQLVDSFTVKKSLEIYGLNSFDASNIKGIYDRAQPLLQLGLVIGLSFSTTLLPSLTKAIERKEEKLYKQTVASMMRIGVGMASAVATGLIAILPQANYLLFGDEKLSLVIAIYLISIVLMTIISIFSSILQSINQYIGLLISLGIAFVIKYTLNTYLIVKCGIIGASIATTLALSVALIVILLCSSLNVEFLFRNDTFILKLLMISCIMGIVVNQLAVRLELFLGASRLAAGLNLLICIPLGVIIFLVLAIKWHLFTKDEFLAMPASKKIIKLVKKFE